MWSAVKTPPSDSQVELTPKYARIGWGADVAITLPELKREKSGKNTGMSAGTIENADSWQFLIHKSTLDPFNTSSK